MTLLTCLQYSIYSDPNLSSNHFSSVCFISTVKNIYKTTGIISKYTLCAVTRMPVHTHKNARYIGFLTMEYIPIVTKCPLLISLLILWMSTAYIHNATPIKMSIKPIRIASDFKPGRSPPFRNPFFFKKSPKAVRSKQLTA